MNPTPIKSSHKAIQSYYESLKSYSAQGVSHQTAKTRKWNLVPELTHKVKGKFIRPDGTLRDDDGQIPRGYWEAKDTADSLDDEIRKKIALGYPLLNTIFEDTRVGVLFQNGHEVLRAVSSTRKVWDAGPSPSITVDLFDGDVTVVPSLDGKVRAHINTSSLRSSASIPNSFAIRSTSSRPCAES